ncbi:MAG: hypothetical protein ACRD9L_06270, partial [Bryobacteraceae bacterium]
MPFRLLTAALVLSAALIAQMRMTAAQLKSFIQSSIELREPDNKLAAYLKKVTLSDRLADLTIEQLRNRGAGPKTLAALRDLRDASAKLPAAPDAVPPVPATPLPAPSPAQQKQVLAEAKDYAVNFTRQLPDFLCTQVTRRYADPTGTGFRLLDTIVEKLTYFDHKEDYQVMLVNDRPENIQHQDLRGSAISSGEFGSIMREIFQPETLTAFEWEKWTTLRGRRTQVFSYRVRQSQSQYRIDIPDQHLEATVAYHGLVYVNDANHDITRITLVADGIPPSFPMRHLDLALDYSSQTIAGRQFLLPFVVELHSGQGTTLLKNRIEFHNYRKFGVEAKINFA